MAQSPYTELAEINVPVSEPRMALLFLVDTSASMDGQWIQALNDGMNRFKEEVCKDDKTKHILDVAIVRFDVDYSILQPFKPIKEMMYVNLVAEGSRTIYSPAIKEALEMVDTRRRLYGKYTAPYKPWILFITDGQPHDDISAIAEVIKDKMATGKVSFRSLAVGSGWEAKALHTLSPIVLRLEEQNFTDFFDWINKSMASVSQSSPGQAPNEVNLRTGGDVKIDQFDMSRFSGQ